MNVIKLRKELAPVIYEISNAIYQKKMKLIEGKKDMNVRFGMNESSFADYYYSFKKMMDGELHQRTIQTDVRDYMLFHIKQDWGIEKLQVALDAFMQHIMYYEGIQHVTVWKDRALYEKYNKELDIINNLEQNEISLIVKNTDRQAIINDLANLKSTDPKLINIQSKTYQRDNKTICQLKEIHAFTCQICGIRIPKANGLFYIEAAHIIAKAQKGPELPENILILCPNHHKEFDYGKLQIIEHDKNHICFRLNEKAYNISLKLE